LPDARTKVDLADQKNYKWVTQVIEKIRRRGVVQLLTVAVLAAFGILGFLAFHAEPTLKLVVVITVGVVIIAFFVAVTFALKYLGVYAALDTTQVITYKRLEIGAKGTDVPENAPVIPDEKHPKKALLPESIQEEESGQ
jgi:hypothetical protein